MRRIATICAVIAIAVVLSGPAYGDSFFNAINQFTTYQKIDGDTGAVVDSFALPFLPAGSLGASIAVVGNTGYYTLLFDANVYKVDMTTHAYMGIAFNTGNSNYMNGITTDSSGNLYFAHGAGEALQGFTTGGAAIGTWAFPNAAAAYRDGSVVFGNIVVANRGDQIGPYDKYMMVGGNLVYVNNPFIKDPVQDFGNNGIGFNGINYYVANEQLHIVRKYDINGNFLSLANLDPGSRYENWTFSSQDIAVPEPSSLLLLGTGGAIGLLNRMRRRKK